MTVAGPIIVSKSLAAAIIDRHTCTGLLSVTFMYGARVRFSSCAVPVTRLTGRARAVSRSVVRLAAVVLLAATCAVSLYAGQAKPKKHDNRHEIEQLEEAWRNAVLKTDTAALGGLLADDYIAITASGTLQTKEEALASLRSGRVRITSIDFSDRKLRFYGHTALVTSLANVKASTAENEVSGSYRYTRVYVFDPQGRWKIVSFEASRIRYPGDRR
jgi:ketosteroid isomerase-like protein